MSGPETNGDGSNTATIAPNAEYIIVKNPSHARQPAGQSSSNSVLHATPVVIRTNISEGIDFGNTTSNSTYRPYTNQTGNGTGTMLVGLATFCNASASMDCSDTPLRQCSSCSTSEASILLAFVLLLGILILIGNLYVLWDIYEEKNKQKLSYIKASMAAADILNGVNLLSVIVPHILWTLNLTAKELDQKQLEMTDTILSVVKATYYLIINISSTYQVTVLSLIQLYVITQPLKSRNLTINNVLLMIGCTWLAALICATIPSWMSESFEYTYQHYQFLFSYALRWRAPKYHYLVVLLIHTWIPYTIMALATLVMYISVRKQLKKAHRMTQNSKQLDKRERNITKTVLYMELGFAITTVPYVVMAIVYNEYVHTNMGTRLKNLKLLTVFLYLYLSRSLVNVIVYLMREKEFRRSIRRRFMKLTSYSSTSASSSSTDPLNHSN